MPLYDQADLLCHAILARGREEAEKILQQARSQAERLKAEEREREQALRERTRREVEVRASHEARNLVDRASLESRRRVAKAKEAAMIRVFALARERLLAFRNSPEYRPWLKEMLLKAVRELGGDSFRLLAHPEEAAQLDDELLAEVGRETGARLEAAPAGEVPPGGFIALTADGRLRYDATFQGILDRKREALRTELARLLWQ